MKRPPLRALAACALLLTSSACEMPVAFGEKIEGEITFEDENSTDSNDLYFYWDAYCADFTKGTVYDVELWSVDGDPIHFEIKKQGVDHYTDSRTTAEYTAPLSDRVWFDIYLRSDFVGDGSRYAFKITPR